jgi:single stranded DNA-binding protein
MDSEKSKNRNSVVMDGHLGADAKIIPTKTGTLIVAFDLAHTEIYKDLKTTNWYAVSVLGQAAQDAKDYRKGDHVGVRGKLSVYKYSDRKTGEERSKYQITAFGVERHATASRTQTPPSREAPEIPYFDPPQGGLEDDFPF